LKEFLSQKGVPFEDKDVTVNPAAAQEMVTLTGQRGVPVTLIDGQAILGFNRAQIEQALSHYSQHPSFGASIADAARIKNVPGISGAYVGKVRPGSIAEHLGIIAGDIINQINGRLIGSASDMENIIAGLISGDSISVVYKRGDQTYSRERFF
jgi:glutaredoxin 3